MNIEGKELDIYQQEAIKDINNNILLVASAGSGKTLTILGKIKYLLENNYKENEILCISFTNKSVNDLKTRLNNLNYNVNVKTFHKLAIDILKNDYSIINENYLYYIIDEYFKSYVKYNKKNNKNLKNYLYIQNLNKIYNSKAYIKLKQTIFTFIKLSKANMLNIEDIYKLYKKNHFKNKYLLKIIMEILTIYTNEIKSINKLDFDDLIINAINQIKFIEIQYKYIIIDEFQDTSLLRIKLIKEIMKKTNAKLFCVGDDYQSIYRFSGCNLNLFINFKDYFENVKIYYLINTYRNSNELIKISNNFIMKNKLQLKKNIVSNKNNSKPIKIIFNKTTEEIINKIDNNNLLILGRNNKDIENINFENKLTIHSSKGLEADNILLVNSDSIPSKIKDENILNLIIKEKDYIIYEEERRLFYVALTRTKNNVYIQVNKKISPFVKELIKDYKNYIEIIN